MNEVWSAMYSALARPSSTRAAPAKKRSWSTIGGISSLAVRGNGLPLFFAPQGHPLAGRQGERLARVLRLEVHQLVGAGLDRVGDLQQRLLPLARRGLAPRLERR